MRKFLTATAAMAMSFGLAACGSNEEAAVTPEATATDAAMAADADNPFAQAEMQMNEKMMAAAGVDAGDSWAKKMIEHHQGAIDMSRIVLEQNPGPDVEKMAREGIEKQQKDMEDIRGLLKSGQPNQASADLYRPAMMSMHEKMMAAKGETVSDTFMRKMLEHHRGAVAMSDVALQNGVSGALRAQVEKTKSENRKDAEMVEAMLGGKSHQEAMATSGAMSAAEAKAAPAPAAKATASPSARATAGAPKAAPKAAATAEPAPTASPTCLPEHRAAGHC